MLKDSIFKNDISNDKGFNKDKGPTNVLLMDHCYDNNIKLNENISAFMKSNILQNKNDCIKPQEEFATLTNVENQVSYTARNVKNEILPCYTLIKNDSKLEQIEINSLKNGTLKEDDYSMNLFGLEEKATNTDELTSSKIDELLSINEQFLRCKEQFIYHCVKNQPDILARMFPDLFKMHKQNQNVKQNLISGVKRKRELVIKQKLSFQTEKNSSQLTLSTLDKNSKKELEKKSLKSDEPSDYALSASPPKSNANQTQFGVIFNKHTSTASIFSSKSDKQENPEKLEKIDKPLVKEKRKYKSAAMKLKMANESAKKANNQKTDADENKEKENNFSFSNKFSEICKVFDLPMPTKSNVISILIS